MVAANFSKYGFPNSIYYWIFDGFDTYNFHEFKKPDSLLPDSNHTFHLFTCFMYDLLRRLGRAFMLKAFSINSKVEHVLKGAKNRTNHCSPQKSF